MSNGAELRYAFKKAAVWNTPVVCGAGNGFLGLDLGLKADASGVVDDSRGQLFAVDSTSGEVKCDGSVPAYLRYNDGQVLAMIAMIMGTSAAPTLHAAGAISYDHIMKVAANTSGLFGTLCGMVGTLGVESIPSWKPDKVSFKWDTGKPCQVTITGPGVDVVLNGDNTTITFNNVTILERANRVYAAQVELRINTQSDGALAAGDKVGWSSMELTFERKQTGVYGTVVSADTNPRDLIDEPTGDGMFAASLKVSQPRTASLAQRTVLKNNVSQKAEIICTGPVIEGAIPYLIRFQMPHLKPKSYENPYEAGIIKNSREYEVLGASAAPTGMAGITDPLWINVTNKITTSLLA